MIMKNCEDILRVAYDLGKYLRIPRNSYFSCSWISKINI